ncbi:uncharacterized protein LOC120507312 [Passer montanus]|uniref:uncharacterized protein LOC120507312 n=1 Tax=Passer montanus TaxID=9160 RepID=UPI0019616DF4|nr:uncharacterized protein LOC120507312 [Passer montanus]
MGKGLRARCRRSGTKRRGRRRLSPLPPRGLRPAPLPGTKWPPRREGVGLGGAGTLARVRAYRPISSRGRRRDLARARAGGGGIMAAALTAARRRVMRAALRPRAVSDRSEPSPPPAGPRSRRSPPVPAASRRTGGFWVGGRGSALRPPAKYGGRHTVTLIPGDGIGPELMLHVKEVFRCVPLPHEKPQNPSESPPVPEPRSEPVLPSGNIETNHNLPPNHKSRNNLIRTSLDLYANVIHCQSLPGVETRHRDIDILIVRENTEGEYSSLEHEVRPKTPQKHPKTPQKYPPKPPSHPPCPTGNQGTGCSCSAQWDPRDFWDFFGGVLLYFWGLTPRAPQEIRGWAVPAVLSGIPGFCGIFWGVLLYFWGLTPRAPQEIGGRAVPAVLSGIPRVPQIFWGGSQGSVGFFGGFSCIFGVSPPVPHRKLGDGLFLQCCQEVAAEYPEIQFRSMIVDNTTMQVCPPRNPQNPPKPPNSRFPWEGLLRGRGLSVHLEGAELRLWGWVWLTDVGVARACPAPRLHNHASTIRKAVLASLDDPRTHTPDIGGQGTTSGAVQSIIGHLPRG